MRACYIGHMKYWCGVVLVVGVACGSEEPLAVGATRQGEAEADAAVGDERVDGDDADGTDGEPSEPSVADSLAELVSGELPEESAPDCEPSDGISLAERCEGAGDARPDRLSEHSAVYDQDRQEMIIFGGTPDVPMNCTSDGTREFSAETWIYDDPCGSWEQVDAAPSARGRHAAAWGAGSMYVFGGRYREQAGGEYTLYDDILQFEVASRRWSALDVEGARPAARAMSALAYDPRRERLWLFGGNVATSGLRYEPLDDLWSFDLGEGTWQQHITEEAPEPRLFHSMLYDESRDWLVVFGGGNETAFDNFPTYFANVWAYDIEAGTWTEIAEGGTGPLGRFWSSFVHEEQSDRYVVFGGHDPGTLVTGDESLGNLNDVWSLEPVSARWSQVAAGDRFHAPNRGFCDFPPDFATLDLTLPERRSAHSFVWSKSCGHALLFGGKTDCGSIDDVWTYGGVSGWRKRLGAREGEVCMRWRDDYTRCTDICF